MTILLTGSSGMIGTRLAEKLLEEGHQLICIDKQYNRWNEIINQKTTLVDLRNKDELFNAIPKDREIDLIIHFAANARVHNLIIDPHLARDNFEILFNVLELARCRSISRILFSSSREVYGNSEKTIHLENDLYIKNCENPYSASKIAGEALIHSYRQCYGINFIILRFSNVYGMYDESDRVIPLFIRLAKAQKDIGIFGKEKLLDFTHIDDTVEGIDLAIRSFDVVKNDIFNIASGQGSTLIEIAQLIKELLKSNSTITTFETRVGEVIHYVADITKARQKLGFDPKITINEGIQKSLQ